MANVIIDIAAEFTGKKGFKQAESATDKLGKNVKKLAGALGLTFSAAAIVQYGKNAVKAFAAEDSQVQQLTQSLKNLGLGFATEDVKQYLDVLEQATGVNKDQLQPALQKILQTTGDIAKSQEILALALDTSAGSGQDLASVSQTLAQAYVGNNKGLRNLNIGLTQAEIKTANFVEIQEKLIKIYGGQAAVAADTYTGKLNKLTIAAENASEEIGRGLVSALEGLAGSEDNLDPLIDKMNKLSVAAGDTIALLFGGKSKDGYSLKDAIDIVFGGGVKGFGNRSLSASNQDTQRADAAAAAAAAKAAAAAAAKRERERLAFLKKELAAKKLAAAIDKAQLALGKGQDIFDIDQIQIAAALTNQAEQLAKTTSGAQALQIVNDTARLNVKRSILALEDAIASKDEASIIKATEKLNADLKILGALTGQELKLKEIKSILDGLASKSIGVTVDTADALNKIKELYESASKGIVIPVSIGSTPSTGTTGDTSGAMNIGGLYTAIGSNLKEYLVQTGLLTSGLKQGGGEYNYSITVNTGIGDPNAIAAAIQTYIIDAVNRGTLKGGATP